MQKVRILSNTGFGVSWKGVIQKSAIQITWCVRWALCFSKEVFYFIFLNELRNHLIFGKMAEVPVWFG